MTGTLELAHKGAKKIAPLLRPPPATQYIVSERGQLKGCSPAMADEDLASMTSAATRATKLTSCTTW